MRIAIVYATREGQTRRIAEYLAGAFQARDAAVDLFDARQTPDPDLGVYDAFVIAGSIHIGKHEPELVRFVQRHRADLERAPAAFLSVSLSAAGLEQAGRTPQQKAAARREVDGVLETFRRQTQWAPRWAIPVAGALLYTKYNFFIRWVMKMISKAAGGSTDTSRDHEYTDWTALERFSEEVLEALSRPARGAHTRPASPPPPIPSR